MGSLYIGENLLDSVAISYDTEDTPTNGSKKPLSSGGAFNVLTTKADLIDGKVPEGQLPKLGYSNEEILENTTKAMYGLGETSVPDDIFKIIAPVVMATIVVTAPTGSTITATNGERTITANEVDGTWTLYVDKGTWTINGQHNSEIDSTVVIVTDVKQYDVVLNFFHIYGVEWDGTSTTLWSRTDAAADFVNPSPAVNNGSGSSPFDNLLPWSGMVKETDSTAGVLVKIPKYWYKWTRSGSTMELQIADGPEDGFLVSPAHADRGDGIGERDYVYVGRYHCNLEYESSAGYLPKTDITRSAARNNISAKGSAYWQYDFSMYWTIMMLYLVEYADWNSQSAIGYGCSPDGSKFNTGATDAMSYHTGTSAANRTTYGSVQYRYIEGLWDSVLDWCDGIYFDGATVYCIKNPASFSDSSDGTNVGTRATRGGYISGWTNPTVSGFEYALYPSEVSGSGSTYVCDQCSYNANGVVLSVGGDRDMDQIEGAFRLRGNNIATYSDVGIGCRLQKLP